MKLYLTSYRIPTPDELFALLPKPPMECRVAIIPNAKDDKLPQERADSLDELIYDLAKYGFATTVVDLREYDDAKVLYEALKPFELIWVAGGNSFILRSEIRLSGFEEIVRDLLSNGAVYAGESAGAIVAGLSLEEADVADDPDVADEYITEGLGLIDKIIAPHADSPDFVEFINHIKKRYGDDPRVVYLRDDQALVVAN
jgi:dipeptidase E